MMFAPWGAISQSLECVGVCTFNSPPRCSSAGHLKIAFSSQKQTQDLWVSNKYIWGCSTKKAKCFGPLYWPACLEVSLCLVSQAKGLAGWRGRMGWFPLASGWEPSFSSKSPGCRCLQVQEVERSKKHQWTPVCGKGNLLALFLLCPMAHSHTINSDKVWV